MSEMSGKYNEIMQELESNIKDPEELKFVKDKFSDLSMLFVDMLDRITKLTDDRIQEIETKQQEIMGKIQSVQSTVKGIENDISEDEMGGEPEPLAGTKILSQMYLREITVKVIVVTMYENFVGTKIKQLDENLRNEYADIYCGYVFFSHSNNEWQSNLKKIINESI